MIPNQLTIHHTASSPDTTITQINDWHKARDFTLSKLNYYIGYHYVIDKKGVVTQTRNDWEMGCHSIPNDGKIGICLIGNFMLYDPTQEQINSLKILVERLKKLYNTSTVLGHRDCSATECPGDGLYKWVLTEKITWLQALLNILLSKPKTNV